MAMNLPQKAANKKADFHITKANELERERDRLIKKWEESKRQFGVKMERLELQIALHRIEAQNLLNPNGLPSQSEGNQTESRQETESPVREQSHLTVALLGRAAMNVNGEKVHPKQ